MVPEKPKPQRVQANVAKLHIRSPGGDWGSGSAKDLERLIQRDRSQEANPTMGVGGTYRKIDGKFQLRATGDAVVLEIPALRLGLTLPDRAAEQLGRHLLHMVQVNRMKRDHG